MDKPLPRNSRPPRLLLALALLVGTAGAVLVLLYLQYAGGDFANNLWGPAHYLVRGWSPYRSQELLHANPPVWFPPAIGLFFPLGWLDLRLAANLWFLGNVALAVLLLGWYREGSALPLAAVILTLLFPPLLIHFWLGQYALLAVALLVLAARLTGERRFFLAGLAVAPALAKPQLAVLALPGLWLAAWRGGRWRGGLLFPAGVFLGTAALTLPLWVAYPNWFSDFLRAQQSNPSWLQPTLYTVLRGWLGPAGTWLAGLVALGALAVNLWLWWRYPPQEVAPWSLGLTTLATPYLWTWDMVLLLPLLVRSVQRQRALAARALWGGGFILLWGALWAIRSQTDQSDHRHWWVPWLIFLLVLGGQWLESRSSRARLPSSRPSP